MSQYFLGYTESTKEQSESSESTLVYCFVHLRVGLIKQMDTQVEMSKDCEYFQHTPFHRLLFQSDETLLDFAQQWKQLVGEDLLLVEVLSNRNTSKA